MNYEEFMQRYSRAPAGDQAQQRTPEGGYEAFMQRYGINVEADTGSQSPGGPLQTGKGGGGQSAAPAVEDTTPAAPTLTEQLFGPRMNAREQEQMRQAIRATRPTPAPAAQGISADVLLPYRQIGERGAAARQAEENPLLKLLGTPARHGGRQAPSKAPAAQSAAPAAPAVSATWRAAAGMDAQQAPAWQQEARQQRQNAAQGVPARQANAAMGTSAMAPQQESESQRRRREARQRALQLNKEALESGASTLDTKSALVELRMRQQQAAYEAQEQAARTERNPAGSLYAPGSTLLGTVQRSGEGLRRQELKNEAAQALAEMTGPEEYLAKDKLSELEKQAALLLLNQYREENRDKLDHYDTLPQERRDEVDQWLALEYKLGSFTSAMDRLAKGARSLQYNLVGTPDVIGQTAKQAAKDTAANLKDPQWSALADQLVQIDRRMEIRRELGGERDPELLELKAQRAALQKQMDAAAQKTPLDLDTYGARALLLGQDLTRQAQTGLSPAGKTAYSVGYSVADNLAVLPLNFIPGVGQAAALGVQGAKAGAQEMLELAQRGVGAEEAFARGAIAGGIEAGTEKIGMDNLVDIVGKGGKQALNSLLKKQLTELAAKGGQSAGASAAAALLSNATAEGLEEAVGYIANYAADQLFGDPESEFSLEEFLASMGQGAAAGLILGGGGMAANALLGGQMTATQQSKPREPSLVEQLLPPVTEPQNTPRESSLVEQLLPLIPGQQAEGQLTQPKAAVRAGTQTAQELEAMLTENLARQEQIKTRVRELIPDAKQIPTVQGLWKQMAQLMDQESEIRRQQEAILQPNAKTAEAQAPAVDMKNEEQALTKAQRRTTSAQLVEKLRENIPVLNQEQPVAHITGQEFQKSNIGIFEQVSQFFKKLGNKVERPGFGEVELLPRGVKNSVAHGIGSRKAAAFASVPDVIRFGKQIDAQENWKGRGYGTYVFAAPIEVGDEKNFVAVVVTKDAQTNRYYLHEVLDENGSLIKLGTKKDATPLIKTGVTAESGVTGKALASSIPSIANLGVNVNQASTGQKNTGDYQVPNVETTLGRTAETAPEITPVTSSIPTEGRDVNTSGTAREEGLVEQLLPPAAPQQSKPREPSLVEQLLPEHYDPGVTIGRGVKADRTAFAQVDRAARALNRPVVVESLPQGHNGYYKDGIIHISAESQSPVMNVFTHELTHHLETSGEYAALAEHVRASEAMQSFLQATDMTMEEYRSFLKDSYARMGIRLDGKAVDAEIVANFCEKFLFKDENSVRRLCGEKPGLGRRILDFIRQLLGKLRGDEAAELRQAERLFVNALSGAQAENAGTGPQLSVQGNAHPQANSGGAGAVSYEALTALPDMRLTQISTALPEGMGIGDAARLGVENSRQPGMKNGRVTNRYTGQEIQITAEGLRHGMTRKTRLQKNGPYALRAGEILQNAVKVNELAPRGNEVRTDIYLGGAIDENGSVHGVRFLVKLYESGHQTADLGDMEVYSGSLYAHTGTKIGTAALRAPEVSNQIATPTVPIIRIADLLGTVKGKMDTFLSESVKENIGAVPGKSVEFGDSQLYSVTPQLTPQEWKQGRRTTAAGMEKGTVAPKVPEVSGKAATPTVPASTIAGARGKVKPGKAVDAENTVVNDDPAAHTAQEQRLIEAYKAAVDPGLARFYERVKAGQYDGRPYVVGRVTDEAARAMEQLTGKQVQGNLVVLDDNGVQHIERRHGKNGEADHSMANLEDIARINFVLENFDQAYRSEQPAAGYFDSKGKKAPVVVFTKKINGTYYVVEAVSDAKSKRNYIISAYLSREGGKKTAPAQRPLDVQAPKSRPKPEIADTGATYSIPTGGRDVNASDGRDPYDLASLFRSDPKRAAVNEAAQARAQQRLQNTPITEEERQARLQGTTGDTVRDTFALHPITEPVNFGMDAESIRAAEQEIRQLKRELGRAERNPYRPGGDATTVEMADAQQVAKGEKTMQQLSAGSRPDVVAELAHLQARLDEAKQYGLSYQKRSIFEHQQTLLRAALDGINDPEALAGKNINIAELNRRTPERAIRRVFGEQKGAELAELVIKPVHQNESAKVQFINKLFDQARALDLNEVERKLVQLVGERAAGKGQKPVTIGDIQSRGITDEMLPGGMDIKERRFILKNLAKADPAKVEKAVGWYKQIYKSLWEVVNDFRLEHGMAEIGWQEDYFPHFNEDDPLTKTLKQLGIEGASGLPTSIAGQTAWFRPNSRYVPFFQQRKGIATSYDSDLGFQSYLTAVADMLYHTDDIMRLRNLDSVLRGKRTELDVGNVVDSILGKKNLEVNAQEAELIEKVLTGEYMDMEAAKNYNTFAQWLTNYTNKLANKQLFGDRSFEEHYGRTAFNIASKIESAFARNSTVGNLSTALNNTITLPKVLATTPQKYVAQAVKGLVSGEFKTSGLAQESEFLLGKRGVRPLVESRTRRVARMISNVTFEPVEAAVSDIAFYAKYLHGLGIGATQSEAIETANDYAAYMMARRSKGARPLALETKDPFHKLFTLFQTEVSNDFFSLRDDLPAYLKRVEAQRGKAAASKQLAMGAAKYCVYSSALNALLENLTGYAPAPDPLRWLWEFMEALLDRDEEEEDTLAKGVQRVGGAVGGLAGNVLNQVPGASTAMALAGFGEGRVPLPNLDKDRIINAGEAAFADPEENPNKWGYVREQLWKGVGVPALTTLLPFGGNQLRKTLEGTKVMGQGAMYSESKDGQKLQTAVQNDPFTLQGASNWLKAAAFGKSAIREVGDYYDNGGKPKSASYTEAYKEGYDPYDLDQLFPGSGKGAGKVTYEQLTGGAKGAAEVDNWLTELMRYQDNLAMLPSNSTTSVTVDGETVKLTGSKAMEFAQTKAETSYNILETLLPTADRYDRSVQEKYAVRAQDYAHAVAKEEVLGVEPAEGSWIEKVQTYSGAEGAELNDRLVNALLGSSIVAEATADYYPNGRPIEGSRKRKAIAALKEAGFDTKTALQMWEVFN